jgi:hypothetical protein
MTHSKHHSRTLAILILSAAPWFAAGCESSGGSGPLLDLGQGNAEKWTIWCQQTEGPDYQVLANQLSDLLKQASGLRADKVRVVHKGAGCTIYYGQYVKVASKETGRLVFPPEYIRDLATIQRTTLAGRAVFSFAKPELMEPKPTSGNEQWEVSKAKGKYTLQIGIFYNTPTFDARKEAAEDYVKLLRQDGFAAYFRHEEARSFVFVGDFDDSDVIKTGGQDQIGPRVEQLIKQREEEFRYMLENLYRIRHRTPDGQMIVPPSMLIPVPGR